MKTKIIAHRGSSNATPENTGASFKKALKDKSDGVELDVHLTADKEVVVIHDEKIDRTSNNFGFVKDYTLKELKEFDFGSFFDEKFKEEKILTLDESLDLVQNMSLINVEIKKGYGINEGIEKRVIDIIKEKQLMDKVLISSFNHESLKIIKEIDKNIKTAALLYAKLYEPWKYAKRIGCEYLHLYYKLVDKNTVDNCHQNDILVNTFTVNNVYDLKKMLYCDVDGIITDFPLQALNLRNEENF